MAMAMAAMTAALLAAVATASVRAQSGVCDPLVPESCMLPFPNNFYATSVRQKSWGWIK